MCSPIDYTSLICLIFIRNYNTIRHIRQYKNLMIYLFVNNVTRWGLTGSGWGNKGKLKNVAVDSTTVEVLCMWSM